MKDQTSIRTSDGQFIGKEQKWGHKNKELYKDVLNSRLFEADTIHLVSQSGPQYF